MNGFKIVGLNALCVMSHIYLICDVVSDSQYDENFASTVFVWEELIVERSVVPT